ncbi:MerR family transcriptional regulator [Nocardia sp. NPDC050712]|uniref:helix-turn-helix domain-containing protein n=1 Tax=Nocardia sp. NPDC050712 TaxID=3155518 RepID=UPI003410D96A
MSEDTGRIGIGELSRRTGVSVRTIRFYCDEGALACERTGGGHRTFDADASDQLELIRHLHGLGIGLTRARAVLRGHISVTEAIAAERTAVDSELAALNWRRAALRAVGNGSPEQQRNRIELLAAVQDRKTAEDRIRHFWRGLLTPLPPPMFDGFAFMNIPELSAEPTPRQLLTFAELVAHLTVPQAKATMSQSIWRARPAELEDRRGLLVGLAEAGERVAPLIVTGADPRPGPALDHFVATHAAARGLRDTATFRSTLLRASRETDPWIQRYWTLTGALVGPATSGAAQLWLHGALARSVAAS